MSIVIPDEMKKKYLERRRADEAALVAALTSGDAAPFVKVGHQLKGNGSTFGYDELAEIGERMEAAGEAGDFARLAGCLEEFRAWIQRATKA